MNKNALLIFIKNPILGKPKTRLAADIGPQKALEIYNKLLTHTRDITQNLNCNKYLFYSDFIDNEDSWNNDAFIKKIQSKDDLGAKMFDAFQKVFQENERVIIIGSDCYHLSSKIIQEAFDQLQKTDTVIGPANDGGYYLLGMNQLIKDLFFGIEWSTDQVLKTTMKKIKQQNLSYHILPELIDIDTLEDLKMTDLSF